MSGPFLFTANQPGACLMTSQVSDPDGVTDSTDKFGYVAVAIFQGKAAIMLFSIIPLILGAFVDHLGFQAGSSGYIISAEILGVAVANGLGFFWVNRLQWRLTSRTLLTALILVNLGCTQVSSYEGIMAVRVLCGLIEGSVLALTYAMLARTGRPDRNFGFLFGVGLTLGAINFLLAGFMLEQMGMPGLFINLSLMCVIPLILSGYIPRQSGADFVRENLDEIRGLLFIIVLIILAANLVYFVGQSGVWSYLNRLGVQHGLARDAITYGLSLSLLAGVAGSLVAAWQDNRLGRVVPLSLALVMALGSVIWLYLDFNLTTFYIAAFLFNFANNYGHPCLLGYLAEIDRKGRYVVASGAMQTGGMALGPAIAGYFVSGVDVTNSLWVGVVALVLAMILFLPIMLLVRRHSDALAYSRAV